VEGSPGKKNRKGNKDSRTLTRGGRITTGPINTLNNEVASEKREKKIERNGGKKKPKGIHGTHEKICAPNGDEKKSRGETSGKRT